MTIEAYLDAERRWWTMPYRFASHGQAARFIVRLQAVNPERLFRLA